jgi:hypothetical protein
MVCACAAAGMLLADAPGKLAVWDGDQNAGGGGWAAPKADAITVAVTDDGGRKMQDKQLKALKFTTAVDAQTWTGFGWNWHGWWPEDVCDDVSGCKNLVLSMKIVYKAGKDPGALQVWLVSNPNPDKNAQHVTEKINPVDFCPNLVDGAWHEVVVPMSKLVNKDFVPAKAWEIDMGSWADHPQDFQVFIDYIGFDNR